MKIGPFTLSFMILGNYLIQDRIVSNKLLWFLSFITSFFIILYTGTIGSILGEFIVRGGMETINIKGTIMAGLAYSIFLGPIFTPLARLIIGLFYSLLNRFSNSKK